MHDEWFQPPFAEDRTIGFAGNQGGAVEIAIAFLIVAGFILFLVGLSSLVVLGAFYLRSHVADLPLLGQSFGP